MGTVASSRSNEEMLWETAVAWLISDIVEQSNDSAGTEPSTE